MNPLTGMNPRNNRKLSHAWLVDSVKKHVQQNIECKSLKKSTKN
jgi:hypothetical protein